jgi:hypothetical protein
MGILDTDALIIFVHLGKRIAIRVKGGRDVTPPDWEMLFHRFTNVRAMGCWLTNDVVECLVGSLPGRGLHTKEGGNGQSNWESEEPAMSGTFDNWAHKWEAESPSNQCVSDELSRKLLHLPIVKLLHPEDLIIS